MKKITGRKERHMRDISETGSVTEVGRAKNDLCQQKVEEQIFIYLFISTFSEQPKK